MENNISKVAGVNANMGETYRQAAYKRMERAEAKEELNSSFSDIYDVRLLSAELNRSSAEYNGMQLSEAGKEMNQVIASLDQIKKSDELVKTYPSEEILALTKLAAERNSK